MGVRSPDRHADGRRAGRRCETGAGSTAGIEQLAAIGVGAVALAGGAATGALAHRRRGTDQV